MKKIFVLATVIISAIVLMLSIGINFAQAEEKMMDKDMMMEKGQMMMDKGKMVDEGRNDEIKYYNVTKTRSPKVSLIP